MSTYTHHQMTPGLAATLAAAEHNHRRRQWRIVIAFATFVALGMGVVLYTLGEMARSEPAKVVIDPANLPPIQAGPRY